MPDIFAQAKAEAAQKKIEALEKEIKGLRRVVWNLLSRLRSDVTADRAGGMGLEDFRDFLGHEEWEEDYMEEPEQ